MYIAKYQTAQTAQARLFGVYVLYFSFERGPHVMFYEAQFTSLNYYHKLSCYIIAWENGGEGGKL